MHRATRREISLALVFGVAVLAHWFYIRRDGVFSRPAPYGLSCAGARQGVQEYRLTTSALTVLDGVHQRWATRGVQIDEEYWLPGWPDGERCTVTLRVVADGQDQTYQWQWTPRTELVEALDAPT